MKTKIAVILLCTGLFAGLASATAGYTTSCGEKFMGPDQEYFETYGEWESFVRDMNEDLCGTRQIKWISDDLNGDYHMYQ